MWSDGEPPSSAAELEALEERTALFVALAERLIHGEARDEPERRAHLLRLLISLMAESKEKARAEVIARVAEMPSPPKDVALALARDKASLAAPLLRKAPFSQNELIELVMRTGPEHHIEIAKRPDLTLDIWLALARAAARRARTPEAGETAAAAAPPEPQASGPPPADQEEDITAVSISDPGVAVPPLSEEAFEPLPDESGPAAPAPSEPAAGADRTGPDRAQQAAEEIPSRRATGATSAFHMAAALDDPGPHGWRFETDREGRLVRLSPNARLAFGDAAPGLAGEPFAQVLQLHSAVPSRDEIGEAMARWAPLHDVIVETMVGDGPARRWRIRAQPRFSFPDGRFEGYVGTAIDPDAELTRRAPPRDPAALLDRLAAAAERLAEAAPTPELRDYAQAMMECVDALKAMPMTPPSGSPAQRPDGKG